MRIACTICTDHYEYSSEISAVHCGHTFHRHCLERWLGTSSTCPQCRQRITNSKIIPKIFLDKSNETEEEGDPGELKNQLDNYRLRIGEKDQEKRDLMETIEKREKSIDSLRDTVTRIEAMHREEQITAKSLRKQLEYFKSQQTQAQEAKEEARAIRTYMNNMKNVETVVKGVESEVRDLVKQSGDGPAAVKQLSTYCVVLKQELEMLKESRKTLKDNIDKQKKQIGTLQREIHFKAERIKQLDLIVKKRVPETPPTPYTPVNVRNGGSHPRLSVPTDNGSFIAFDPDQSVEEISPPKTTTNSAKRKADCEEFGTHYIKIRSAALNCPSKKPRSDSEPLQDVATPQHFNILKNRRGTDNSGMVRTGYNGLGTHTKFFKPGPPKAQTIGKGLMKQKGKQSKLSSFLAL